ILILPTSEGWKAESTLSLVRFELPNFRQPAVSRSSLQVASFDSDYCSHCLAELDQTVRIFLYSLIFLLSVAGNTLVITVLIRNKRIRTVTNLFLLSLAISDLMLCFFCMPFTLIPNLLQDFIFGSPLCKITMSVSTFSLVAISLERYSAICKPLQSRVWQTKSHALKVIAATWCLSFVIMTPYPIYSTLVPSVLPNSTTSKCRINWPSTVIEQYIFQLLILFLIPGIVMMIAYGLISLELYRGIKFDATNLMAKKLVIRMLIVIVILFFICWTPIFSVNTWRAFDSTSAQLLLSGAPISFIHLLSYTSACVNPIVYCFMNKRFRLGFLATFTCCTKPRLPAARAEVGEDEEGKTTRASLSRYSYTHMNMKKHCKPRRSDRRLRASSPSETVWHFGISCPSRGDSSKASSRNPEPY
uniref:Gastrin/cholecystokinin type B receptor n=1 Tax=Pseudonaja textilis TaxID=8673 RepID=A0A670YCS5_PSETE